jgi:TonB-linked SusC/RagA family outer membrane protein
VAPVPAEWYLQDGDQGFQFNGSSVTEYAVNSYFGRLFYSYKDKYQFTGNFRADGNSVFNADNRWGEFPGVSAGWVISKENFMDNQKIFDFLKLKGSWGELGNSLIPSDASVNTLLGNIPYWYNSDSTGGVAGVNTGSLVPQIKDLNLKWEITKEYDLGLEYATLNNRLSGELDYYDKKVTNALIYVEVPGTFGSTSNPNSSITPGDILTNGATIDNRGIEFSAKWHDNINKNLSYFVGGNLTMNRNRVLNLNGGLPYFDGNINGYFTTETKAGYPIGAFFLPQVTGVFQTQDQVNNYKSPSGALLQGSAVPGDLIYKFNPNGSMDTTYQGSYQPKLYLGLSAGLSYKGIDFSIDLYSNIGNQVYNGKQQARVATKDNIEEYIATSYWTLQNKSETQPAPNGGNLPASSYFLSSGTFYRINNATLGYTLPVKLLNRQRVINSLRIYASAQNPVTIKKYKGFSSELPGSDPTNAGIELGTYPTTRTFAFGVNLGL